MVLLVGPDTVVQLWFVTTTGLVFLVLYLALSPYRDQAAGRIQLAALVQLEFTYVSSYYVVVISSYSRNFSVVQP